jgi:PAS domain S-box-containing protein
LYVKSAAMKPTDERDSRKMGKTAPDPLAAGLRQRAAELQDAVKKLERELAEHRRDQPKLSQLSRVFRDAADSIIIEDLSGTIVEMNREAERLYGWRRGELIGRSIKTLLLPDRYHFAWQLRQQCLDGREVRNWEGFREDKYGRVFPILVTAFPLLDESGRIEFIATITKDVSILKELEAQLRNSQRRLKEFSRKAVEALEADRKAVSRELHDRIGGNLAAIRFALESVARQMAESPDGAAASLQKTILDLAETIKECKRMSADLRPELIDDRGLLATLEWHLREYGERFHPVKAVRQFDVDEGEIPDNLKIVIYRVIQEAMNNSAFHSNADTVSIRLKKSGAFLEAEVEDNGRGFDFDRLFHSGAGPSGFGLKSMRERVEIIGGSFSVDSLLGVGTRIRIVLPLG